MVVFWDYSGDGIGSEEEIHDVGSPAGTMFNATRSRSVPGKGGWALTYTERDRGTFEAMRRMIFGSVKVK